MKLDAEKFDHAMNAFKDLGLLTQQETQQVAGLLHDDFPYSSIIDKADSVHLHVKVDDVAELPSEKIQALGVEPVNAADGYVKYPFPGGINLIFSSIPIAEDDNIEGLETPAKPFMDHAGIDLRDESKEVHDEFQSIPSVAETADWRRRSQGSAFDGKPVYCCHTEVSGKHWVYPPEDYAPRWTRPIEFQYGELRIHGDAMGCDLRPIDPAHPLAENASCESASDTTSTSCGDPSCDSTSTAATSV